MSSASPISSPSSIRRHTARPAILPGQWGRWLTAATLLLSACGGLPPQPDYASLPIAPARELDATPFFPQSDWQCGPAALATVLGARGLGVTPDELRPQIYLPERRGSLQAEILAAPARYGQLGVQIKPDMAALLRLVSDGYPVLVLQNLGLSIRPVWHYAVVIGYDLERRRIVLRSGTDRRVDYSFPVFLKTWSRAGYWGMVVVPPGEVPPGVAVSDYLAAASALERQQQPRAARSAYLAATRRWPDSAVAWAGAGNTAYALGDPAAAARAYRQALAIEPSNRLIMNNLALALARRGCLAQAREVLACARRGAAADPQLAATADEISRMADTGARCAAWACPLPAD